MKSIANFSDFLDTAAGSYVLQWEQRLLDQAVSDIFGYHALQLGVPALAALRENRMPLRCVALEDTPVPALLAAAPALRELALVSRFDELPFAAQSIDLIVLPHGLDFAAEPHRLLREIDRVLVPDGHLVLTGFNPASLWGAHHWMRRLGVRPFLPRSTQMIALPRLKDWLKLLSFEVNRGRFGCYLPWARTDTWIARWVFLEKAGDRWWPVLGSVYALTAVKRVHGMRLIGLVRKRREERRSALAPAVPLAHREGSSLALGGAQVSCGLARHPASGAAHEAPTGISLET